jgi:ABC-2 type transport system permease protein
MNSTRIDPRRSSIENLQLYGKFIGIAIRSRMQYRSDFIFGIIGIFVLNGVNLALIWVMINRFKSLAGWAFWEIVMLYGTFLLSHSIYAVFFWHLSWLEDDIVHGRFDQYLIRPCNPHLQILGREVNYMGVGDVVFASTIFGLAYTKLDLNWGVQKWIFLGVILFSGLVIETCISWIFGSLAFWFGRSRAIYGAAMRFQLMVQQYPLDIFGQWFRIFVTGFLPVAFINYYPLTVLLDKSNAMKIPILGWISPIVAVLMFLLGSFVWQRGLQGYSSSGS